MVPVWVLYIAIVVSMFSGAGLMSFLKQRRQIVEVDRTPKKEVRPLNVFDAYSDKDLEGLRKEVARLVRQYRDYNVSQMTLQNQVEKLRKIDDEIEARKNAKRTEHERDIAIFDTVYGHLLKDTQKEIK